ncbi:MAG TPA: preprotein translocase subunit SecG [Candidatus Paceibacterota bacterium]
MQSLLPFLPYVQIVLSVLLITAILLQRSSAGLGGAFGESSNFSSFFHARRGAERFLFNGTITLGVLFALTALVTLLVG